MKFLLLLKLSCSRVIRRKRQSMPSSRTCQLSSSSLRCSSCKPGVGSIGWSGASSSMTSYSFFPLGSTTTLGWQALGGSHAMWPNQFFCHLHITLDSGGCFDHSQTSSLVMKSVHLMLKIFLMHILAKVSSFFSWLVFRC